jgi:pilus assembly protein Flp/PilA
MYDPWKSLNLIVYSVYWSAMLYHLIRMAWMRPGVRRWVPVRGESGQGLVEYALILVLVAVVVIGVLMVLGPSIKNIF